VEHAAISRTRPAVWLLHVIFFFSGLAGLGYQLTCSKLFTTGLGHEMPAILAVVCAFMGGMGLGAWSLDRSISRSLQPGRWYAALELVIGFWGFLSAALIPFVNSAALHLIGVAPSALRHWTLAFLLPFVAILPATAAMGATLPAMERFVARLTTNTHCVGALYAGNTFGAVIGTLLSAFVLMPLLGLRVTVWLLAAVNLVCGVAVLLIESHTCPSSGLSPSENSEGQPVAVPEFQGRRRGFARGDVGTEEVGGADATGGSNFRSKRRLNITLFCTGLLGIGYEVVGVRVLSQVLENTVYTFAAVLALYLLGTSLGAALCQRFGRRANSAWFFTVLLGGLSTSSLLGILALANSQQLYDASRTALGDRPLAVLAVEMTVAAAVFALPTIFMGAAFSHLIQAARRSDGGIGEAVAINTFGSAAASAIFGVVLLSCLGSKWTLVVISLGYVLLFPKVSGWRWVLLVAPGMLFFALPPHLRIVQLPPGGRLADFREGVMASVAVVEDAIGQRTLRVNNRFQMGGTAAADAEYRHAHIPLLLHPRPRRALFLGLGTGITVGAAGLHPDLQAAGVELVPEIVDVMPQFAPYNFMPTQQPRLKLYVADARRFVRVSEQTYDVIVADLFHPARDGAGSLYTREHFQAIRQRLAAGGLFCQWLPLHQLDEPMLRVVVRTFLEVFPNAQAYLLRFNVDVPVLGLVGELEPISYDGQWLETRVRAPALLAQLKKLGLADSLRLFGNLVAGPKDLRDFAGPAPLNTDNQQRVLFGAPRFTYQKNRAGYGTLLGLLKQCQPNPAEVLHLGSEPGREQFAQRLADYLIARNVYLKGLVDETTGRKTEAMNAYIESARLSQDFTSGYAQCLTIASFLAKTDPPAARALLQRLVDAQPARPVARELLQRLLE
jgi:spermidine synthase